MEPFSIAMLIFAALSTVIGAASTAAANRENLQANKENLQQQQRFAAEQSQQANQQAITNYQQFQSPAAQVKQIREAGLNPAMIYGKGGVGGTNITTFQTQSPSSSAPVINPLLTGNNPMEIVKQATEAAKTKKDTEKTGSEMDLLQAQENLTNAKIEETNEAIKNIATKTKTEGFLQKQIEMDTAIKELDKKYLEATAQQRIEIVNKTINQLKANIAKSNVEIDMLKIDRQYKSDYWELTMKKTTEEIKSLISNRILTNAQTQLAEANVNLTTAQTKLKEAEEELTKAKTETERENAKKVIEETKLTIQKQKETQEIIKKTITEGQLLVKDLTYYDIDKAFDYAESASRTAKNVSDAIKPW